MRSEAFSLFSALTKRFATFSSNVFFPLAPPRRPCNWQSNSLQLPPWSTLMFWILSREINKTNPRKGEFTVNVTGNQVLNRICMKMRWFLRPTGTIWLCWGSLTLKGKLTKGRNSKSRAQRPQREKSNTLWRLESSFQTLVEDRRWWGAKKVLGE